MNKICKLSAIALLASSTSLMAQSKSFEGVSLGVSLSAIGVEVAGSSTNNNSATINNGSTASGSLGKVAEIAAVDLSYGFAIGPNGIIQVGASYTPGKAKAGSGTFSEKTGSTPLADTGKLTLEVKDPYTIYIAPTYAVSKDSAIYAKLGYSKADVNSTSTGSAALSKKPGDLEGYTYAIGSKTMLTPNLYLGVEASVTDYDTVSATVAAGAENVNDGGRKINADVKTAQGIVTLGYKF
jgi:hypothetical protein